MDNRIGIVTECIDRLSVLNGKINGHYTVTYDGDLNKIEVVKVLMNDKCEVMYWCSQTFKIMDDACSNNITKLMEYVLNEEKIYGQAT